VEGGNSAFEHSNRLLLGGLDGEGLVQARDLEDLTEFGAGTAKDQGAKLEGIEFLAQGHDYTDSLAGHVLNTPKIKYQATAILFVDKSIQAFGNVIELNRVHQRDGGEFDDGISVYVVRDRKTWFHRRISISQSTGCGEAVKAVLKEVLKEASAKRDNKGYSRPPKANRRCGIPIWWGFHRLNQGCAMRLVGIPPAL